VSEVSFADLLSQIMNKLNTLQLRAIKAAKDLNWEEAISLNQEIIDTNPQDIGALNRLGLAYMQANQPAKAKENFNRVLEIDNSNGIAKKHLESIKQKRVHKQPLFSREQFIEEPGTTKIIELHRLANKTVLEDLAVGLECELKLKGRYISIETEQVGYIGALPEDLSFRLAKLIKRGNEYQCFIYSANPKSCKVYIKEEKRSKQNENINSFPLSKNMMSSMSAINDVDERFLLEDNIPVAIVETDTDEELSLKDIHSTEEDPE
jgi:tetratricopeptide (TPR) repeat protein